MVIIIIIVSVDCYCLIILVWEVRDCAENIRIINVVGIKGRGEALT